MIFVGHVKSGPFLVPPRPGKPRLQHGTVEAKFQGTLRIVQSLAPGFFWGGVFFWYSLLGCPRNLVKG